MHVSKTTPVNRAAIAFHSVFWVAAFVFWLVTTRSYHPNWTLRVACTSILVGASAVFAILFSPRVVTWKSAVAGLFALVIIGFVTATAIHVLYDLLIGPDPRRFSFPQNLWMDIVFVFTNAAIAWLVCCLFSFATGRSAWRIRSRD